MTSRVPGKRLFDLVVATILTVLTSPALLVSTILVKLTSEGPVLYRASRIGRGGEPFTMLKLRSMYVTDIPGGSPTTGLNDPRVTPVGNVLRTLKLDELPQLLNVLRGDMSLVGPRPEVPECVALYTPSQKEILSVRPGMTDLASIEFADLASAVGESEDPHKVYMERVFDEKNRLRLEYVHRRSWRLDLEILWRTFLRVAGQASGLRHS